MPLYPQNAMSQGTCPNSLLFCYFHLKFIFESIKELGSTTDVISLSFSFHSCAFLNAYPNYIKKTMHLVKLQHLDLLPNLGLVLTSTQVGQNPLWTFQVDKVFVT